MGSPDLHKLSTSIIIPDYSEMKVEIIDFEYTEVQNINIAPSKGNITRDINPAPITYQFSDVYKNNNFFPENIISIGEPYILRDFRGTAVQFSPIQYNPEREVLRVYTSIQ